MLYRDISPSRIVKRKLAKAFAEQALRQKERQENADATSMARANTASNAVKREKLMEFQREELINIVPEIYPLSYTLTTESTEDMIAAANGIIITNPSASSSGANSCANHETVDDPRMGPTSPGVRCPTCSRTRDYCTGHRGYIPFRVPILTPYTEGVKAIVRVLNLVCGSCGKLKVSREEMLSKGLLNFTGIRRMKKLERYAKNRQCRWRLSEDRPANVVKCDDRIFLTKTTKGDKDGFDDIYYKTSKSDFVMPMTAEEVYEILNLISDEDADLMGFEAGSHPRNLVWRGLSVIPPASRPPNVSEKRTAEHDLTRIYRNILKDLDHINKLINESLTDTIDYQEAIHRLRLNIKILIGVVEQSGGRKQTTMSIKNLISSKGGLVVRHLQGKRVEGSGRAVLSLDPRLRIGQIGIPRRIARSLTVREVVTPSNIESFNEMLKNNEIIRIYKKLPGRSSPVRLDMDQDLSKRMILNIGDEVDRVSRNGDIVFVNRNPTLSRQSIIAGEVVITDDRLTIDTHLSYMKGLAGDYDGDEINVHGPSTVIAREEARDLLHVKNMLISWQTNQPNLSVVFDAVTACSLMTQQDTFLEDVTFQRLLGLVQPALDMDNYYKRLSKYYVPINSGQALFSAMLPAGLFYQIVEPHLNVQDGILISGSVTAYHIGAGSRTITQAIFKDIGRDEAIAWLDNAYRVGSAYLDVRGFTMGPQDFIPDDPAGVKEKVEREYQTALLTIERMSEPRTAQEAAKQEKSISLGLDRVRGVGAKVLKESIFDRNNNLKILFNADYPKVDGSRIAQVQALVGQFYDMANERPKSKLSDGQRCLPMFDPGDQDPVAHGFCKTGYAEGLSPADTMFSASMSRESIIVKYVFSSTAGKASKTLAKGLEDVMTWKDGSVVASGGWIVQPLYGGDGFAVDYLETVATKSGTFPFFTNVTRLAGIINNSKGYVKTKDKWERARR